MPTTFSTLGSVQLSSFIMNASGPNDVTLPELEILARSGSAAIVMKTCTLEAREGNEEPRYTRLPLGSINSMGLPNLGYREYIRFAPLLKEISSKPLIASLAGMKPDEFPVLVEAFQDSQVDALELNFSCPNIKGKPQLAYDPEMTSSILTLLKPFKKKPIGLKLPPYFDPVHWEQMAQIVKNFDIQFLTCINSVGNTLVIDPETESPVIRPKGGFGGLGGAYIKPVALANVRAFSQLLGDRLSIIGVGGIDTGLDAFEFLLAGASAVQIGTQFEKEGADCFARIDRELSAILKQKKYPNIAAARGKLKLL